MRGFTLMEMLVVVLVMGLLIGLVSAVTRPDDRNALRVEAERLALLLDLAGTESRLTGKPVGWTAEGHAYKFWRFRNGTGWSEIRDSDLLRTRSLPQGMAVSGFRVESGKPLGVMRLEFSPYSAPVAFRLEMSLGTERYTLAGSPIGDITALPGQEGTNGAATRQ